MQGIVFMLLFYFLSLTLYMAIVIMGCTRTKSDGNSESSTGKAQRYFSIENKYGVDVCPICLEDFDEDSYCSVLECSHVFHYECINEWFVSVAILCPLCQQCSE